MHKDVIQNDPLGTGQQNRVVYVDIDFSSAPPADK